MKTTLAINPSHAEHSQPVLIVNGTVLDPAGNFQGPADVLLVEGRIAACARDLSAQAPRARRMDAAGCLVTPGLIDMHVHLRQPGQEHKETIATGAAAAVAGGFTTICCMPNTTPALDNDTQIEYVLTQASRAGLCQVLPMGAITKGRQGAELAELMLMHEAGAIGFSDDGVGVGSAAVMTKALQYIKMFGGLLSQHCEEPTLSGGSMHAGAAALRLGLGGLPAAAEELMIARDLLLNRCIAARYHVQHVSTAGAVDLIRQAKRRGETVSAEVAPHHLLLTDDLCGGYDSNFKMNPPLRSRQDVDACIAGVIDGTLDCLATDHAPHAREEKEREFDQAPFGIVGLETALPLYAKALVAPGHLTWLQLIDRMSLRPAAVLGLKDRGSLAVGCRADVTVIDPEVEWQIDPTRFYSRSTNTPFAGWKVRGQVRWTIVAGQVVFDNSGPTSGQAPGNREARP